MRLFLISRHGESTLNTEGRINGDPAVPVGLSDRGREEAKKLGEQIAHVPIELCIHTRFLRTLETSRLALAGRDVPFEVEPLLDDVKVGELEGETIGDYRAWKRAHTRADPFPGGESLDDSARRYARAYRRLLDRGTPNVVLIVTHEIPLRYALNAAAGSDDLDGPMHEIRNATPYLFDEPALEQATERIEQLAGARLADR
jgi:broad specificity phosphatase PhoE